ncbi:MAG: hypothetical protein Q8P18_30690 [Pseudomonadota bacterium]|nr:hypothetical protein [Pseudomonadota bacterium]
MRLIASIVEDTGWVAWVQLAAFGFGLLWTLVCAVLLALRWKVPAALPTAFLGVHALIVIAGSVGGASVFESAASASASERVMSMAMGIAQAMGSATLALVVVPAAALLALGGMAGGVRAPRSYFAPVVAFLLCGLAAILPLGGLFMYVPMPTVGLKVLLYGLFVIPVALSLLCNGQDTNGREASISTTMAFMSVVAATELASVAMAWGHVLSAIASVDASQKSALLTQAGLEIAGPANLGWASFAISLVVVLIAVFRPSLPPTDDEIMSGRANPSSLRGAGVFFSFAVPVAWVVARIAADPTGLVTALVAAWPA